MYTRLSIACCGAMQQWSERHDARAAASAPRETRETCCVWSTICDVMSSVRACAQRVPRVGRPSARGAPPDAAPPFRERQRGEVTVRPRKVASSRTTSKEVGACPSIRRNRERGTHTQFDMMCNTLACEFVRSSTERSHSPLRRHTATATDDRSICASPSLVGNLS